MPRSQSPLGHGSGGRRDDVGIVDRLGRIGAEVDRLMAQGDEPLDDGGLEREAGMIAGDGDAHPGSPQPTRRSNAPLRRSPPSRRSRFGGPDPGGDEDLAGLFDVVGHPQQAEVACPMFSAPTTVLPSQARRPFQ